MFELQPLFEISNTDAHKPVTFYSPHLNSTTSAQTRHVAPSSSLHGLGHQVLNYRTDDHVHRQRGLAKLGPPTAVLHNLVGKDCKPSGHVCWEWLNVRKEVAETISDTALTPQLLSALSKRLTGLLNTRPALWLAGFPSRPSKAVSKLRSQDLRERESERQLDLIWPSHDVRHLNRHLIIYFLTHTEPLRHPSDQLCSCPLVHPSSTVVGVKGHRPTRSRDVSRLHCNWKLKDRSVSLWQQWKIKQTWSFKWIQKNFSSFLSLHRAVI